MRRTLRGSTQAHKHTRYNQWRRTSWSELPSGLQQLLTLAVQVCHVLFCQREGEDSHLRDRTAKWLCSILHITQAKETPVTKDITTYSPMSGKR